MIFYMCELNKNCMWSTFSYDMFYCLIYRIGMHLNPNFRESGLHTYTLLFITYYRLRHTAWRLLNAVMKMMNLRLAYNKKKHLLID